MIADLKPYPAYKNSDVPWLGEVPGHWDTRPLKRWVRMNAEVLPETTAPDYEFCYRDIGSVGMRILTQKPQRLRFATAPSRARRVVHKGDTIVSTVRTYLKAIYFADREPDEFVCSTGFAVLTPRVGTLPKFVSYLAQSNPFTDRVTSYSVGIAYPAIAETRLGSFHVAVPPLTEQAAIVRFLDHADRRIRRYIRAKQKLIKLLEEQKQAIIHHAVTRGLDPNVHFKPSGVERLGKEPQHREVKRLKWVTRLQRAYDLPADRRISGPFPVVSSGGIIDSHCEARSRGPGVVMGRYGSTDAVFFLDTDFWPHNTALFVTDFHGNRPRWCYFMLRTISKADHAGKSAVPGVDRKDLFEIVVATPPVSEQDGIVAWIETVSANLDRAIAAAQREINLLREYRTRLIADVVTGKLDVREAAARLPDEAEEPESLDEADALSDVEEDADDDLAAELAEAHTE